MAKLGELATANPPKCVWPFGFFARAAFLIRRNNEKRTMNTQKFLRYNLPATGENPSSTQATTRDFNEPKRTIPPEKLFADLLKRLARRVMADVTECPAHTIPAHMARLSELREIIEFAVRHELVPGNETLRSDKQLIYAATVTDFLACLELTRQNHRAPVFVSDREEWAERIERKLDLLAGLVATNEQAQELFNPGGAE